MSSPLPGAPAALPVAATGDFSKLLRVRDLQVVAMIGTDGSQFQGTELRLFFRPDGKNICNIVTQLSTERMSDDEIAAALSGLTDSVAEGIVGTVIADIQTHGINLGAVSRQAYPH